MISRTEIKARLETYSCNIKKNTECHKRYCICNNKECERTTNFKYAKRNLLNYLKRIINILRGRKNG